jgi:hypothetical protein
LRRRKFTRFTRFREAKGRAGEKKDFKTLNLFYCKDITPEGFCTLDSEESRHAVRVLRLREGDELNVTDGRGNLYRCRIVTSDDRACVIEAAEQEFSALHSPFSTSLFTINYSLFSLHYSPFSPK